MVREKAGVRNTGCPDHYEMISVNSTIFLLVAELARGSAEDIDMTAPEFST